MKERDRGRPQDAVVARDTEFFAAVCKALGHPARVMIINYLKKIDRCLCGDIVDLLPLAQSTVSQHLKCLKDAGLVKGEVKGPRTCYCLDKTVLQKFTMMVDSLGGSAGWKIGEEKK